MSPATHDPTRLSVRALLGGGLAGLALLTLAENGATRMFATPWTWILAATLATPLLAFLIRLFARNETWRFPTVPWLIIAALVGLGPLLGALLSPYREPC